jgi:hypothetical protein
MNLNVQIVLDCADPHRQARFWADGTVPRGYFQAVPEGTTSWSSTATWRQFTSTYAMGGM